jgi:short-subunit dehydrogenase
MSNKQHVLITGGTSGIGYELAKLFAIDGYNLVLAARSEDELEKFL